MKKYLLVFTLLLLGFVFFSFGAFSQDSTKKNYIQQQVSISGYGTTANMPFWMRANQYATAPISSGITIQASKKDLINLPNKTHWRVGYGIDILANISAKNQLILPELYGQLRYKKWELYVGRKREIFGLCDTLLGTGSYIWSGNALPMPKIQLSVVDYIPLKFTNNSIALKGTYAHGWFGASDYAYRYYLHQKSFYARIGKLSSRLKLYGGLNHQVQWGGKTYDNIGTVNNQTLPSSFNDYLLVITGSLLGKRGGANAFDSTNRVGNHLGSLDIGAEFEFRRMSLFVYRQNLYEDGSLARSQNTNIGDGLQGVSLNILYPERTKGKISLKKALFELLVTTSQGGKIFDIDQGILGRDNYFNHQQYYDGWSYKRKIIGTPFITNYKDTKVQEPFNSNEIASNNRVIVYHLGFEGYYGENLHFLSKLSYSLNYGTYGFPYPTVPKQFSGLFQVDGQLNLWDGLEWTAAVALDQGELYKNTFGGKIGIRKSWSGKK
ncbi:capsule assembly Wzi family protein [Runella sp.]|uniref:capsule assembly Wzi family protein n=1 Tax=Runella sp. TaxID=1960881 RepID=UPI003D0AC8C8